MASSDVAAAPEPTAAPPSASPNTGGPEEFEMVLGKRQAAVLIFLTLVLISLFSGGSYLLGRTAPVTATPQSQALVPDAPPVGLPTAEIVATLEAPLLGKPLKGPIYIQLGAVEKGIATLLTHGARKLGFGAFVTQGTTENNYRVLVGPFKNAEEYEAARAAFKEIGLGNFSRRYQEQ
jgi:hypothetical protein